MLYSMITSRFIGTQTAAAHSVSVELIKGTAQEERCTGVTLMFRLMMVMLLISRCLIMTRRLQKFFAMLTPLQITHNLEFTEQLLMAQVIALTIS